VIYPHGPSQRFARALTAAALLLAISGCTSASPSATSRSASGNPAPSASPSAISTEGAASPSASPAASPSPTISAFPLLANLAIVSVTVEALNLRASASQTAAKIETLAAETRLFVIGSPQEAGELSWYRVAVVDAEAGSFGNIGWVATPANGVEGWLEEVDVDCPSSPTTIDALAALAPLERLHCYGNQEFTATGWVDVPCCGYVGAFTFSPWLADPNPIYFFRTTDGSFGMQFKFAPDAGLVLPETTNIIRFTGHFEDPAAPSCRVSWDDSYDNDHAGELPDPAWVVLGCRTALVLTGYEVIGYKPPVGSCGCLPPSPPPETGMAPQTHDVG
jgi:hypothetical protein